AEAGGGNAAERAVIVGAHVAAVADQARLRIHLLPEIEEIRALGALEENLVLLSEIDERLGGVRRRRRSGSGRARSKILGLQAGERDAGAHGGKLLQQLPAREPIARTTSIPAHRFDSRRYPRRIEPAHVAERGARNRRPRGAIFRQRGFHERESPCASSAKGNCENIPAKGNVEPERVRRATRRSPVKTFRHSDGACAGSDNPSAPQAPRPSGNSPGGTTLLSSRGTATSAQAPRKERANAHTNSDFLPEAARGTYRPSRNNAPLSRRKFRALAVRKSLMRPSFQFASRSCGEGAPVFCALSSSSRAVRRGKFTNRRLSGSVSEKRHNSVPWKKSGTPGAVIFNRACERALHAPYTAILWRKSENSERNGVCDSGSTIAARNRFRATSCASFGRTQLVCVFASREAFRM